MAYVKWTIIIAFWVIVAAFLHYTLPQNDIVRITGIYEDRVNVNEASWAWSSAGTTSPEGERLVFFIQSETPDGDQSVYRNEDTGWGWPPYFKFNTADLHAKAGSRESSAENPRWFVVRHYGWRNVFWSIYPNALSIREVDSPDTRIIPWTNIAILTVLFALFWAIRVRWKRFQAKRIDPVVQSVEDRIDDGSDWLKDTFSSDKTS
ncbi:DUF1523 family protein [Tropicibacter sp. R15_0]|uniref:DUF1523 family protein n=1 Tax=Tropicibacter sp. R15_0 TaxID=2821101 RepID=UPI001ADBA137|nr:DUF1523 family protein [Tropicibacter sp. R15_0]MBO9464241.1 DUF1523 family protein [Tropicibacter sp. R15_0]